MSPSKGQQNKAQLAPEPLPQAQDAATGKTQGEEAAALQSGKENPDPSAAHQQEYDEGAGPIYVSYKEVKGAPSHATKYSRKLSYIKYFYLTDIHAKETLAAIGEDQGDAHYIYRNVEDFTKFGTLDCHNRKELVAWLDRIRRESQEAANFHLIEDPPEVVMTASPVGSPMRSPTHAPFVAYRQEKFEFPSGHRGQKWYLVDESGHEQLAVSAEERDTRDGHYTYKAEGPLAQLHPDIASNMSVVSQWLDGVVAHPDKPHMEAHSSPRLSDRGRAQHTPANQSKPRATVSHTHSQPKRWSHKRDGFPGSEQRHHKQQGSSEASIKQEAIFLLRQSAEAQSRKQRAVGQAALDWLQAPPTEEQKQHVDIWMGRLKEDLSKLAAARQGVEAMDTDEGTSEPSSGAAPPAVAALLDSLEALRELGGTHFTSQLMHSSQIVPFLQELKSHKVTSIAELAAYIICQLQAVSVKHVSVLTDSNFTKDPIAEAEKLIQAMEAKLAPRPTGHSKGAEKSLLAQNVLSHATQVTPAVTAATQVSGI